MTYSANRLDFLPHVPDRTASPLTEALALQNTAPCAAFHASLPGYQRTPLHSLESLAKKLGIKKIWLKDESARFGLGAFKVLGASYAIARQMAQRMDLAPSAELSLDVLTENAKAHNFSMECITASDGNHGCAVAWFCKLLGLRATVLLPKGGAELRAARIRRLGATVEIIDGSYDDAVCEADRRSRKSGAVLVQDTAWDGYEEIPLDIMRGYCTIVHEIVHEMLSEAKTRPTHVFLQAGVGSFASAISACLSSVYPDIVQVIVEPRSVCCLYETARANDGRLHSIENAEDTCMTSLCCETPSSQAWEILRRTAHGFIACDDSLAEKGQKLLLNPEGKDAKVVAGLSGAVTTGVLGALCQDEGLSDVRGMLHLDKNAGVLLISTEGDVDAMQ